MPRYTALQRRRLVRQFQSSGLTLATFCRLHSLSVSSLCAWRRHVELQKRSSDPAPPPWLPVEVSSPPGSTAAGLPGLDYLIEAGLWRLHVPSGFGRDEVAALLELLHARQGGAPC
ncbi:IS66 family insertion sequence element accessory protein TnpA [Verrucomicrobium spinosum]|uniref:IS66 family insertion sequence element accessory protein TnpA n=1 Tax=Verrucomicrobium spinosum TaxID=2736 RepID=UPI000946186B